MFIFVIDGSIFLDPLFLSMTQNNHKIIKIKNNLYCKNLNLCIRTFDIVFKILIHTVLKFEMDFLN